MFVVTLTLAVVALILRAECIDLPVVNFISESKGNLRVRIDDSVQAETDLSNLHPANDSVAIRHSRTKVRRHQLNVRKQSDKLTTQSYQGWNTPSQALTLTPSIHESLCIPSAIPQPITTCEPTTDPTCIIDKYQCNPDRLVCPLNIEPVCGCDGRTFGNRCIARFYHCNSRATDGFCPDLAEMMERSSEDIAMGDSQQIIMSPPRTRR